MKTEWLAEDYFAWKQYIAEDLDVCENTTDAELNRIAVRVDHDCAQESSVWLYRNFEASKLGLET